MTDLNKYSKIKVFFDTGEDGEGHTSDVKGEFVVNETINTDSESKEGKWPKGWEWINNRQLWVNQSKSEVH